MESFSLLKYWRASTTIVAITTGTGEDQLPSSSSTSTARSTTTTTVANEATTEEEEADGSFFDLELSSVLINEQDESDSASESLDAVADTKTLHHRHSPPAPGASLLKSATRFRVFALGLNKKLKSESESDTNASAAADSPKSTTTSSSSNNSFFVEVLAGSSNNNSKAQNQDQDSAEEEKKKKNKELVQKYINSKIKPMYVRVCRRYGERFSVPLTAGGDPTKKKKKVVMVKSRSAVQRRDDSLLQQEDGIQSAIAHCKKSFNASLA